MHVCKSAIPHEISVVYISRPKLYFMLPWKPQNGCGHQLLLTSIMLICENKMTLLASELATCQNLVMIQ